MRHCSLAHGRNGVFPSLQGRKQRRTWARQGPMCRRSSTAERRLPKPKTGDRPPSPAPRSGGTGSFVTPSWGRQAAAQWGRISLAPSPRAGTPLPSSNRQDIAFVQRKRRFKSVREFQAREPSAQFFLLFIQPFPGGPSFSLFFRGPPGGGAKTRKKKPRRVFRRARRERE